MLRLKTFKQKFCNGENFQEVGVKKGAGWYFGNKDVMKKRCKPMASDASKFVIVSNDTDFVSMMQEIFQSMQDVDASVSVVPNNKNFKWDSALNKENVA